MSGFRTEPWITLQARRFLKDWMHHHPGVNILEFGAGGSTIWFSQRDCTVTSVEHDQKWVKTTLDHINKNKYKKPTIITHQRPYNTVCDNMTDNTFDLILVDGRDRVKCVESAMRLLKPGGLFMVDNSEREEYIKMYWLLREWHGPTVTRQIEPDEYNSFNKHWETAWWHKPL